MSRTAACLRPGHIGRILLRAVLHEPDAPRQELLTPAPLRRTLSGVQLRFDAPPVHNAGILKA